MSDGGAPALLWRLAALVLIAALAIRLASSNSRRVTSEGTHRLDAVRDAMRHAWSAYVRHAWGKDELRPVSKSSHEWLGLGVSIVDSLDTLWLMGLKEEFKVARAWVESNLTFERDAWVSTFETSIRVFGGLLSAYDLTRDRMFLDRARDVGDRLASSMNASRVGIPAGQTNLGLREGKSASWTGGNSVLSEVGTLQLEYVYLAAALREPHYAERALDIYDVVHRAMQAQGLGGIYPVYVSQHDGRLSGHCSLGALGDSFFEYVLKLWKMSGERVPRLREMYDEMVSAVVDKIVKQTSPSGFWYLAELRNSRERAWEAKMDELACFAGGGMFAYGAHGRYADRDMAMGARLADFCRAMWQRMPSGIAPEYVDVRPGFGWFDSGEAISRDFSAGERGTHYVLRPETFESYFYMWRLTKDRKYREWGWEAFQAIERNCKVPWGGYSGIRDVTVSHGGSKDDLQQSFFMAETLKYLYLLLSDDDTLCNLDEVVFNTEAHPLSKLRPEDVVPLFAKFDARVR